MLFKFLSIAALFGVGSSIHLQQPTAITTQITSTQLNKLDNDSEQQKELSQIFQKMQNKASRITGTAKSISSTQQLSRYLEEGLASQYNDLDSFQKSVIPTIQLSPSSCSSISDEQRIKLISKIECAMTNIKKIVETLNGSTAFASQASVRSDLDRRAQIQYLLLEQIKRGLQIKCQTTKIVGPTIFFNNLNARNWIYGTKVKKQDFEATYNKLYQQGSAVTICDISKPFVKVGTTQCFNCQEPNNVFDMSLQACIKCPGESRLQASTHQCQCPCDYQLTSTGKCQLKTKLFKNGNYLNVAGRTVKSVEEYKNKFTKFTQNSQVAIGNCNQEQNSVLTGCIQCPTGTYFLVDSLQCVTCSSFDSTSRVCSDPTPSNPQPKPQTSYYQQLIPDHMECSQQSKA